MFGCGYYFVIECYGSVVCDGCALLDPNERLSAPAICFVCVVPVMSMSV